MQSAIAEMAIMAYIENDNITVMQRPSSVF